MHWQFRSPKSHTKYEERARPAPLQKLEDDSTRTSCEAYRLRSRKRQRALPPSAPTSIHCRADAPVRAHTCAQYARGGARRALGSLLSPSTMPMASPAYRGISRPPTPGRRRLGRRLLRARGCGLRRCGSTPPPCGPLRAGISVRLVPSHVQLHHWPHFDATVDFQDGTPLRELHCLLQITGFDQRVTANDVLGLGKRTVGHCFLFAFHQFATTLQRLALVFDMTFLT